MNFIQKIKTNLGRSLHIILDDEEIIVSILGEFDNKVWYSWVTWGPTECTKPSYKADIVTSQQIIERISLLSNDEKLDSQSAFSISRFFGYTKEILWENI